ncbi:hypothetical protein DFH09DRAFT_1295257 [Mycena vulgaris]|nr:hypothetical protein DFH09DRAFT_1295257 [Mycena vulgaris]
MRLILMRQAGRPSTSALGTATTNRGRNKAGTSGNSSLTDLVHCPPRRQDACHDDEGPELTAPDGAGGSDGGHENFGQLRTHVFAAASFAFPFKANTINIHFGATHARSMVREN